MIIIGCDFHTCFQEIAGLDTDTGERQERQSVLNRAKLVLLRSKVQNQLQARAFSGRRSFEACEAAPSWSTCH